ncbi:5-(carboxyamino)imidazole ribonucleotide synthase [Candidatus Berkiella aquae]|uniref:N5-carboxyaminoimidazole ribonucleotide synthase n=1 Tax=Candidatus Berkiella aquae TaxID=295108 RepID=A0A0Q9YZ87_9GAMM|nr:5-(carboxyamino)imidazole ribonucleotide synthase [Candidatus Berkiella aquae]MCS5712726.1 5-(carboxyamino)imidazole ribonucleotide synthase [Candidatus Berkiella aquae]
MKIGILGGGQLSRMLALAGSPLGLQFVFLEPSIPCSAQNLGELITADYTDEKALLKLAKQSDIITYENENIPTNVLEILMNHQTVHPNLEALQISQDRFLEKTFFQELGIPTTPFAQIDSYDDLFKATQEWSFPFYLKKRKGGYDGKGQIKISNKAELTALEENADFCQNIIVEQNIHFDREVSMIAVRNPANQIKFYDINENIHQNGVLFQTQNKPNDPIFALAKNYLTQILQKLSYVGILCVEFFQVGDQLIANEMAPRVHNSGHWTIEGAVTSQFENHLRAILNWPLGETQSIALTTMTNLLGTIPNKKDLLSQPALHLHDYNKEPRNGRKVGHYTKVEYQSIG